LTLPFKMMETASSLYNFDFIFLFTCLLRPQKNSPHSSNPVSELLLSAYPFFCLSPDLTTKRPINITETKRLIFIKVPTNALPLWISMPRNILMFSSKTQTWQLTKLCSGKHIMILKFYINELRKVLSCIMVFL
jgi:hypothetical protein